MEWLISLVVITATLVVFLFLGVPVFASFWITISIGFFLFMGGLSAFPALITSLRSSVAIFTLTPVPFFILMGETLFISGLASGIINALEIWLQRFPGRLSAVAVAAGTVCAALSGSSLGDCAMLASVLTPDMRKRGYNPLMITGPIMAGAMLAVIIPPSVLIVIIGSLGEISVGKFLIAGIVPGLIMATLFICYIAVVCSRHPELVPPVDITPMPLAKKLKESAVSLFPAVILIFLVLGTIFLGVCTPTEASAIGAFGTLVLAAAYRKLNWKVLKECVLTSVKVASLALIIATGSMAFSQLLGFTGSASTIMQIATSLPVVPILIVVSTLVLLLIMGCFIDQISMIMIGVPIFIPIAIALGFDPLWYGILFLLAIAMGYITPPFGMLFFVIKGVIPADISMGTVMRSGVPYLILGIVTMILILLFPPLATWLPGLMVR